MNKTYEIHKAAGILIKERKLLVARSFEKEFFVSPGGKVEEGEDVQAALERELGEEFTIKIHKKDIQEFGVFYAKAAENENISLRMDVFLVNKWVGEIKENREIEELRWITSEIPTDIKVGSIFEHEVIPRLRKQNLID